MKVIQDFQLIESGRSLNIWTRRKEKQLENANKPNSSRISIYCVCDLIPSGNRAMCWHTQTVWTPMASTTNYSTWIEFSYGINRHFVLEWYIAVLQCDKRRKQLSTGSMECEWENERGRNREEEREGGREIERDMVLSLVLHCMCVCVLCLWCLGTSVSMCHADAECKVRLWMVDSNEAEQHDFLSLSHFHSHSRFPSSCHLW